MIKGKCTANDKRNGNYGACLAEQFGKEKIYVNKIG